MNILSFDPGQSGAFVLHRKEADDWIAWNYKCDKQKVPTHDFLQKTYDILSKYPPSLSVTEMIRGRDGWGAVQVMSFGKATGAGLCLAAQYTADPAKGQAVTQIEAQNWKRHFGLINAKKNDSILLAKQIVADSNADDAIVTRHDIADAILINQFFQDKYL